MSEKISVDYQEFREMMHFNIYDDREAFDNCELQKSIKLFEDI